MFFRVTGVRVILQGFASGEVDENQQPLLASNLFVRFASRAQERQAAKDCSATRLQSNSGLIERNSQILL